MSEENLNDPNEEMVSLSTLPGVIYAEMVKETLENNGIPCVIKSDLLSSGLLAKSAGLSDDVCRIYVHKKHQKKAQTILEGMMDHI